MSMANAENDRRAGNALSIGNVISVSAGKAAVKIGDLTTPELPVLQLRAGILSFWWMPTVGEQVLVGAPGGDMARAVVIGSLFAGNAPSDNLGEPMIDLAGGRMVVKGNIIVEGDVIASGVSLVNHTHKGVTPGTANTGEPNGGS